MNSFPLLAAFTLCVSLAILTASFHDLREAPLTSDAAADQEAERELIAMVARVQTSPMQRPHAIMEANEGLSDRELASADPIQAWLDRTLTPPADYIPPRD
jgi:hypothetical protein